MMEEKGSERGRPAGFDPESGAVRGSGAGAGGGGNPDEDYDADPPGGGGAEPTGAAGTGHPLPASGEARHGEIPEHAERAKGRGDDAEAVVQPAAAPVTPEGESYRYADLGRGPGSASQRRQLDSGRPDSAGAIAADQAEHQDRGQSIAAEEEGRD